MKEQKITRDMTIEDIFFNFPQKSQKLAQEITNAGLHCVGCSSASYESIEMGLLSHGMSEDQIDTLVKRLNDVLEEVIDLSTITLTKAAAKKFNSVCKDEEKEGLALRLAEKAAGCSGFEYSLDFSESAKPTDEIFHSEGIEIHVHKGSVDRLRGCVVDYVDGLQGAGFKVTNPNVKSSCHCGTSHGY